MQEWFRWLLLVYFITHIPITIFIDAQVVFDRAYFPQFARDLFDFHLRANQDFLFAGCRSSYPYVRWIGACEVFLQLPFFFYAVWGLWNKRNEMRIPAIIYCTHVPTTVIPAWADFLQNPAAPPALSARLQLFALYGIYFVIPCVWLLSLVSSEKIWPPAKERLKVQ
jgi:hypothetical protein